MDYVCCVTFFVWLLLYIDFVFFFSSRRRHTRCALVTGVQTCALPISVGPAVAAPPPSGIKSITGSAEPISAAERQARIARAQRLMRESGLSALLIEPGARLVYFTGVQWGRSERLTAAVLPVEGEIAVVTPFFEEPSVRESLGVPAAVLTWTEHADPLQLVAGWLGRGELAGPGGVAGRGGYFADEGAHR